MELDIAAAKINRYATSESGDSLEVVERPNGGLSVVLADGQTHGKGAKVISSMVVRKVISLLAEGVRDGAAARAASDYLYTERNGKVSACLNIVSADLHSRTLVIARNNPTPVFVHRKDQTEIFAEKSAPIGTSRDLRPSISEIDLEPGMTVLVITDGVFLAGDRIGRVIEIKPLFESLLEYEDPSAQSIADKILSQAIKSDEGRPNDDMSVVIFRVHDSVKDSIRRMSIHLPVPNI